uniref:hypothetical protein n=1 Tax=Prevotella sp. TaxID=59823 RepID=UPI003FF1252B
MKESKKVILGVMKKHLEHGDWFESQALDLTLSKMEGSGHFSCRLHRRWNIS